MKRSIITILIIASALIAGCRLPKEETATSGRMHVLASESQAGVMREQVALFNSLYADATISMQSTSTRDAIVQFLNDSVRVICIDRAMNAEERAVAEKAELEVQQIHVAEDALAFIVHPDNPMTQLTTASLRNLLAGSVTQWSGVPEAQWTGAVRIACTGRNSGTYELLSKTFFKLAGDIPLAFLADSQRATVSFVQQHPGALGIVPVSAVRDTTLGVRVLEVEATDTTETKLKFVPLVQAYVYLGTYPYHYPVYVYLTSTRPGLPAGFSRLVTSAAGQKIFQKAGLVPKTMPVRLVQLKQEEE